MATLKYNIGKISRRFYLLTDQNWDFVELSINDSDGQSRMDSGVHEFLTTEEMSTFANSLKSSRLIPISCYCPLNSSFSKPFDESSSVLQILNEFTLLQDI